jgi:hypothetical protein
LIYDNIIIFIILLNMNIIINSYIIVFKKYNYIYNIKMILLYDIFCGAISHAIRRLVDFQQSHIWS